MCVLLTSDWLVLVVDRCVLWLERYLMKKKLLVLLITVIPALMPNLASAIAIDTGDVDVVGCTTEFEHFC